MTLSIDTQHNSIDRHCPECHYAECRYAECRYIECHNAECRYAECRGDLYSDSRAHYTILFQVGMFYQVKRSGLFFLNLI